MKRFLLCALALMAVMMTYAQDIIVTTKAEKIEAKIVEVSKSEIKYKEKGNPDGPTFIIETSEISSVIYANGKVVVYGQETQAAPQAATQPAASQPTTPQPAAVQLSENMATVLFISGDKFVCEIAEMNSRYVAYMDNGKKEYIPASQIQTVTLPNGQVKTYTHSESAQTSSTTTTKTENNKTTEPTKSSGRIYRDGSHYLHNDIYISSKEVERILKKENAAAYKQWQKAYGLVVGGSVCTGIGGGLIIGGLFFIRQPMVCIGLELGALVPLGIGLGLTLGASAHYNKAIDIYNSKYDQAAVQLRWSVSPNNVGLAIAF